MILTTLMSIWARRLWRISTSRESSFFSTSMMKTRRSCLWKWKTSHLEQMIERTYCDSVRWDFNKREIAQQLSSHLLKILIMLSSFSLIIQERESFTSSTNVKVKLFDRFECFMRFRSFSQIWRHIWYRFRIWAESSRICVSTSANLMKLDASIRASFYRILKLSSRRNDHTKVNFFEVSRSMSVDLTVLELDFAFWRKALNMIKSIFRVFKQYSKAFRVEFIDIFSLLEDYKIIHIETDTKIHVKVKTSHCRLKIE